MSFWFNVAALGAGVFGAAFWSSRTPLNLLFKFAYVAFSAWAAVMIAKGLVA